MGRYIDADKLLKEASKDGAYGYVSAEQIADFPTADVVEVVRCKECKHADLFYPYCTIWEAAIDGDGYCYKGEKE